MGFRSQETTFYAKEQSAKGTAATVAGSDAIEIDAGTTLVRPDGVNIVERTTFRPGGRLPRTKKVVGKKGVGEVVCEMHGGASAGAAPEFGLFIKSLLAGTASNAAGTVADAAATDTEFDSALDLTVGQAVRVLIGAAYETRRIATKSGEGPYTYTVDRAFSGAPADGAPIAAGISYFIDTTVTEAAHPWITCEGYEDGAKYLATDTRCRSMKIEGGVGAIIRATFGLKALTCQESDASDALTPEWDEQDQAVGQDCTIAVGGSAVNLASFELSLEAPAEQQYMNDVGLSGLPVNSSLNATGKITEEMLGTAPMTAFFAGTLADISIEADRVFIQMDDCQYDKPDPEDADEELQWGIPVTITGDFCIAFF